MQHAIELGLKPAVTTDEAKVALRGVRAVTIEEIKALQEKCAANAAQIAKEREEGAPLAPSGTAHRQLASAA